MVIIHRNIQVGRGSERDGAKAGGANLLLPTFE
jgi:hypothetical protein